MPIKNDRTAQIAQAMGTCRALQSQRLPWESWWDNLREYVLPRRIGETGYGKLSSRDGAEFDKISDTTAVEACQKLASGHMSYITPSHELWFQWGAPDDEGGDEAEAWYNKCSEIAFQELAISNFYTEIHECYLDRVGLGTGSMYVGSGADGRLLFTNIPCGQFSCAENDEGRVDTYCREFTFSLHQAERMFGRKALGEKANEMIASGKDPYGTSLRFLHLVRPRKNRDKRKVSSAHMAYESLYISMDDHCIVEEGGYREFPYLVTRFLKWGGEPYGLAPGRLVYPAIRQAQFLNRILDTLGEVAAFPRILELANQIGEVDLRAGGRTVITPEAASLHLPREWATQGRYDIGMERLNQKQEEIRRAYYLPMLELWTNNSGTMTATEVTARENERIRMFSPSFTLFVSDLYPAMCRIFSLLFRMGRFPKPPRSVLRRTEDGDIVVREPKVVYQSKLALVLRRLQSEGIDRSLQRLSMMVQASPELVDHVDWDSCFRLASRFDGAPERMLRPIHEVERIRRERQAAIAPEQNEEQVDPLEEALKPFAREAE